MTSLPPRGLLQNSKKITPSVPRLMLAYGNLASLQRLSFFPPFLFPNTVRLAQAPRHHNLLPRGAQPRRSHVRAEVLAGGAGCRPNASRAPRPCPCPRPRSHVHQPRGYVRRGRDEGFQRGKRSRHEGGDASTREPSTPRCWESSRGHERGPQVSASSFRSWACGGGRVGCERW